MRVAVVGHVEWIEFARVDHVPTSGEIVHALETWEVPGGGGAVAAVELSRLAGDCLFLTALGDDELGRRAASELSAYGVRVEPAWRPEPQRRAFVHIDIDGERTITVIGARMGPHGDDALPWDELADCDAVYLTAGDAAAVRAARQARKLVATIRAREALPTAGVQLDALVASSSDVGETYEEGDLTPPPVAVVRTEGRAGGSIVSSDGSVTRWAPAALPGPPVDAYGAGDCFAAGFTFGLAQDLPLVNAAAIGAERGAACMTRKGPYAFRPSAAE